MTRYSLAASRSFGRPAASFIAIRWSSEATRTRTPKRVVSTEVLALAFVGDVGVVRRIARAVCKTRETADDHEVDSVPREQLEDWSGVELRLRHGQPRRWRPRGVTS